MTSFLPVTSEQRLETELKLYIEMLACMRPASSKAEKRFIQQFIAPLGALPDSHGNYWLTIPQPGDVPSQVLWSSHTDTVHRQGGIQSLAVVDTMVSAVKSDCLGADCTTGVWLMRQMILARVPGVYVFHRAEEIGGLGSQAIACRGDQRLAPIKFAIAFDRKGVDSVITHQMMGRCCSEAFVASITPMLPGAYRSDKTGSFTDTANYVDDISECTNISVGYYAQHTAAETQDLSHMVKLARALALFDETQLVAERDPTITEYDGFDYDWRKAPSCTTSAIMQAWDIDYANDEYDAKPSKTRSAGHWARASEPRTVYDVVRDYPNELADWLEQQGYDVNWLMGDLGLWKH